MNTRSSAAAGRLPGRAPCSWGLLVYPSPAMALWAGAGTVWPTSASPDKSWWRSVVATVIGLDVVVKSLGASTLGLEASWLAWPRRASAATLSEQKDTSAGGFATEREVERRMAAERERQYQLSRKSIDAINVKCHDIKHQIRSLADGGRVADGRALEDLAAEIAIYDSTSKTGNPALDVILFREGPGLLGREDHAGRHCGRPRAGVPGAAGDLLALRKRAGQRHRGGARHRGSRTAAHLAQRATLRHHVRHQRGEQLRRGAHLQGRRARHDQGRRRQPRLWHQEHARHRRASRRRPHLWLRGRNLPRGDALLPVAWSRRPFNVVHRGTPPLLKGES